MKWLTTISLVLVPSLAAAHIHLTYPKSRTDMPQGDQKAEHCGLVGYDRGAHADRVSTFAPGATITMTWAETINHPGYFRISFQNNGEIFHIPASGNGPPAGFPSEDLTGTTDAASGSLIIADRIADGTLSKEITLPTAECANCTLQLIQVMTDKPPYTTDVNSDDVYFNCADIVISANAPDAGMQPSGPDAGTGPGNPDNGGQVNGGCAAAGDSSLLVALGALGGALVLRRRRR